MNRSHSILLLACFTGNLFAAPTEMHLPDAMSQALIDQSSFKNAPDSDRIYIASYGKLQWSTLSTLSNISSDFGTDYQYDYHVGGFLFSLWGDEIDSDNGGFKATNSELIASHNGLAHNDAQALPSGNYDKVILAEAPNAIAHEWGHTPQYVARYANEINNANPQAQTYLFQTWPTIESLNLAQWQEKIQRSLPKWQQVLATVNNENAPDTIQDAFYYLSEHDRRESHFPHVALIPAANALSFLYDEFQVNNIPPNGRPFVAEIFKYPDFSNYIPNANGDEEVGYLSPEGEYYISLITYGAIYNRSPLGASRDISFNYRGWSGYSDKLFPNTPYPDPAEITIDKATYYQQLAWQFLSQYYRWDADDDTVLDHLDLFPLDAAEHADADLDGVGDNQDAFPLDATETHDADNDGVGDNRDAFPNDPNESSDTDGDGVGDNGDVFPLDATETHDADNDGVGDNRDAFPLDASETHDTDADGVGDNGDVFPLDTTETHDADNDGVGDNRDAFPNDPNESSDTDGDGVGDNADLFPNNPALHTHVDKKHVGDVFFIATTITSNSMMSMFENVTDTFGHNMDYRYQLAWNDSLFHSWGDNYNPAVDDFTYVGDAPLRHRQGSTPYRDFNGLSSGNFDSLIIADNWDHIRSGWGHISRYTARFANYQHQANPGGKTYLMQTWPFVQNQDLSAWRQKITDNTDRWQQVADTVNGVIASSDRPGAFYIPEQDRVSETVDDVTIIPAGLALAALYDAYQINDLPPNGREFLSEVFKYPDFFYEWNDGDGTNLIGSLSPEGEYLIALVTYATLYEVSPIGATNNIAFNGMGELGYNPEQHPQTPYPANNQLPLDKAQYYQRIAWQVVKSYFAWPDNHGQTDADGDGVIDVRDAFPADPTESVDSDNDGIGDQTDLFPNEFSSETAIALRIPAVTASVSSESNAHQIQLSWLETGAVEYRVLYWYGNESPTQITTQNLSMTLSAITELVGLTILVEASDAKGNAVYSQPIFVEGI
ncbi:thrombospondin type 3 repeat-containing protein [Algibacillus agarilyticus]|uniref:thrombospondin type 3 repeat-containing protein n=1 Tax=Algibacillus agarilyticus TaxID=2234133 RepID=UPI001E623330|nr:thrombospondin type 3 repeat-containing protein [Algibacillus agarilyticus]